MRACWSGRGEFKSPAGETAGADTASGSRCLQTPMAKAKDPHSSSTSTLQACYWTAVPPHAPPGHAGGKGLGAGGGFWTAALLAAGAFGFGSTEWLWKRSGCPSKPQGALCTFRFPVPEEPVARSLLRKAQRQLGSPGPKTFQGSVPIAASALAQSDSAKSPSNDKSYLGWDPSEEF